ncbi:KipI family sensor histidine kinase inhibitor [Rhizobium cellulosilyticum]|uniref:KipI family sensor histidine kinase inhibitor n=2 Tax=Aliirhizobium cellulosilyticum TaxID=393664 RepID=A0A7W6XCS7_9HYPH|nr:5-oxoprolinase subunit PxpB [Rhizobium cellulosilyticum]MBB4350216.1 KipI family sensor histidine kinase inhibitor [Rhizobium cellulosilyticum]MBB4413394.1 KipI family sensor histidine kinase inhibitor [Rhizobium cellulosilyticum]MBB4447667.1 KipI family sensor histidine kinase inhibitor [Rhizobium cellulosilyticum]
MPNTTRDTSMRILPVRGDCILVELADLGEALALFDALKTSPIEGITEIIPAARTLLVSFDPYTVSDEALVDAITALAGGERKAASGALVEIPVRYNGEDLAEVAGILGMSAADVIRLHGESDYVAAFTGFAPGFAYLSGGDPRLAVPRRKSPRTQVPAGAVGLAGEFSGIYPKTSPGGWQLIGTTPLAMFDIDRTPASLLQPGSRIKFRDMAKDAAYEIKASVKAAAAKAIVSPEADTASIEILSIGLPILFQDLGRAGQAGQGISVSGAADRASFKAANRLVGNPANTTALEITLGGLSFRMRGQSVMALTGATMQISITGADGSKISGLHHTAIALDDGDVVSLGTPESGMRSYLALRGGFDIAPVLASTATDTLAQIGPAAPVAGDVIGVQAAATGSLVAAEEPAFAMPSATETIVLDVVMGPRTDWFSNSAVESFLTQEWSVTPQSSRVGIRLSGDALERSNHSELPSEATVRGALQVPASGQPVLFLADHPLTGGYPVIANVAGHHLDLAGQIPVGAKIRFNAVSRFAPRFIPGKCP